ncbi:MAG TPA: hypothetical protein VMJ12_02900 [Candidatus Acidoferrales bacterium]|nr:hypothetical protein [Candidatus Acidoferrales bacterium]
MRLHRVVLVLAISALTTSCIHYAPRVKPSYVPQQRAVIFYGRFFIVDIDPKHHSLLRYNVGLRLYNEDTQKSLFVPFSETDPVLCVTATSGHYALVGWAATSRLDGIGLPYRFKSITEFDARPGTAIYLGDYCGYAEARWFLNTSTFKTGISEITNNYVNTTKEYHEKYPYLAAMPDQSLFEIVNQRSLPAPNTTLEPAAKTNKAVLWVP